MKSGRALCVPTEPRQFALHVSRANTSTSIGFGYAAARRRALTVLPDGSGIRNEQDTEDRIVRATRLLDALASGGAGLSELRFVYDHTEDKPGKLAEVGDTAGLIKSRA